MSHNPEPGRPQPYQRLTSDQHEAMASWPHTPKPRTLQPGRQGPSPRLQRKPGNPRKPARQARPPPRLPPRRDHGRHQARRPLPHPSRPGIPGPAPPQPPHAGQGPHHNHRTLRLLAPHHRRRHHLPPVRLAAPTPPAPPAQLHRTRRRRRLLPTREGPEVDRHGPHLPPLPGQTGPHHRRPQLRRPQRSRRIPPRNAERRGPPDHHTPDPPQPRSPSPPHRPHLARRHRPLAPTRLLNHARKPTPASNHRTKPITHPLRPPHAPEAAHRVRNPPVGLSGLPGRFPQQLRPPGFGPLAQITTPPSSPPTSPFPPLWRGLPAFQGREPCETAACTHSPPLRAATGKGERRPGQPTGPTAPSLIISGKRGAAPRPHNTSHLTARRQQPHNNPTTTTESSPITGDNPPRPAGNAPARWRTTVDPRSKRRRGPQGPRSNRQPQSPATGHRPKLPPPPVGGHLLPLQHRLHHGHPGAPNLHRFQQPVGLIHHLLVQLLPSWASGRPPTTSSSPSGRRVPALQQPVLVIFAHRSGPPPQRPGDGHYVQSCPQGNRVIDGKVGVA